MKICITLDDVIRAKTKQFGKILKKSANYSDNSELDEIEVKTNDLSEVFGLSKDEYNKFTYEDYPFEIFGEAPVMEKMLDKSLNLWHIKLSDLNEYDENTELMIANAGEFNTSIGFTCFFLSKIATRVREFFFPKNRLDIWREDVDVLITADPDLLKNKPDGKVSVKIKRQYNEDCTSDIEYDNLSDLLNDNDFFKKVNDVKNG